MLFSVDAISKLKDQFFESTFGLLFHWKKNAITLAKIQAASFYVKAVQSFHRQVVALVAVIFVLLLLAVAVVVSPYMLILFAPITPSLKFLLICVVTVLELVVPSIILSMFLSERKWMEITKANEFIEKVLQEN